MCVMMNVRYDDETDERMRPGVRKSNERSPSSSLSSTPHPFNCDGYGHLHTKGGSSKSKSHVPTYHVAWSTKNENLSLSRIYYLKKQTSNLKFDVTVKSGKGKKMLSLKSSGLVCSKYTPPTMSRSLISSRE